MSLSRINELGGPYGKALQLSFAVHAIALLIVLNVGSSLELADKLLVIDFSMEDSLHIGGHAVSEIKTQRGIVTQKIDTFKELRAEQHVQDAIREMRKQDPPVLPPLKIRETTVSENPKVFPQPNPAASLVDKGQMVTMNSSSHDSLSGSTGQNDGSKFAHGAITTGNTIAYSGGSEGPTGLKKAEYLKKNFSYIRDMIQKRIIYPALAKRMGWEGKVTVSFIIVSDGQTKDIEVKESSGRDVFDKSAIDTIRIASPFPAPPTEARIIIPILYRFN